MIIAAIYQARIVSAGIGLLLLLFSLPIGFPRQEYWSELPFPSPGVFPTQESNPHVPFNL